MKKKLGEIPVSVLDLATIIEGETPSHSFIKSLEMARHAENQAEETLTKLCEKYDALEIKSSYYLSRALYQLGNLASRRGEYKQAIALFDRAMQVGNALSTDEILTLMIDKSQALRSLGEFDQAMLTLSFVINYHAVSALRLKAMLLRAEIYHAQGRVTLARKQLESLALKGGEWALRAKEKLAQEYAYE